VEVEKAVHERFLQRVHEQIVPAQQLDALPAGLGIHPLEATGQTVVDCLELRGDGQPELFGKC
jgi:hypothetical protein